jgi:hypothetical protein
MRCAIPATSLLAAFALFMVACRQHEPAPESRARVGIRADVIGCYALLHSRDSTTLRRAAGFRLDSIPVVPPYRELHPAWSLRDSVAERMSFWSADSLSDTVRVSIGDGFTGVVISGVRTASGLRGRATGFSDRGPTEYELGLVEYSAHPCDGRG